MPHPSYALPRDLAAALARIPSAAPYLETWYRSGNVGEAVAALRKAASVALHADGEGALSPAEREEVGRMLADLEALR